MQTKLEMLLEKYSVGKTAVLDGEGVVVDGKALPLLPWRNERRFVELRKLVADGELTGISTMRILRIVHRGEDLEKQMAREIDLAQFILGSKVHEIFAIGDLEHAVNMIAKTVDGYVCSFELSATLSEQADVIDKHEIIAIGGVACDRAADTQVPQNSIYVYGEGDAMKYTDVDAELFGLNIDQCAVVRAAFETAKSEVDLSADVAQVKAVVAAAKESLATLKNIVVEG